MSDRIQFTLGAGDEGILEELRKLQSPQWPQSLDLDNTIVTRVAVRVLHAHVLDGSKEWVMVKGGKVASKPLVVRKPSATSRVRFDVALDESDRKRLGTIVRLKEFDSEAFALRIAIAYLHALAAHLAKGRVLMWRWPELEPEEPIDLASIARDAPYVPAAAEFSFPVQSDSVRTPISQPLDGVSARQDKLFAILWFTIAFNRFLATRVALINDLAARARSKSIEEVNAEALTLHSDYDLCKLLDEFCAEGESILHEQYMQHRLLPQAWSDPTSYAARLADGKAAVESFLAARVSHLQPWPEPDASSVRWRNWTRSRATKANGKEYRECPAALEWTGVLHHWLVTRDEVSPAMVAHELQTWLVDAFGVRNNEHVARLAESCTWFNREFYADASTSDGRLRPANEKRLELQTVLNILGGLPKEHDLKSDEATSAVDLEKERWARFVYIFLSIARVVQPVYRWERYTTPTFDQVEARVASLTQADLPELRARVFGGQTAIDGLHWILHGGIVPRIRSGRAWLIYGKPGSGKSTLALQLAADMARRGRIAIVCSEERAEVVFERLLMFNLNDAERYRVISREEFETTLETGEDTKAKQRDAKGTRVKGLLVIFNATREEPKLELARWLSMVSSRARVLRQTFARSAATEIAPDALAERERFAGVGSRS